MNKEKLHVCCNIDDNYAQHCGVMLSSLFNHTKGQQFDIHLLISQLSDRNKKNLEELITKHHSFCHFHVVDSEKLKGVKFRDQRPLTEATYYRLLMSSVLDESVSKVLYLDTDIIVMNDITPLFSIDISNYALAATRDIADMTDEHRLQLSLPQGGLYFNTGMMLVNLDYWRKTGAEMKLVAFAKKERRVINHDQDALNAVFQNKWYMLSPKWNRFYPYFYERSFFENKHDKHEFENNPMIIHYIGHFKPWNKIVWVGFKWNKFRKLYYSYLKTTPWKDFKPASFRVGRYRKLGLYRFLINVSMKTCCLSIINFLKSILKLIEYFFFAPALLTLKFYYTVTSFKKRNSRN